jgi:hypothetical protein
MKGLLSHQGDVHFVAMFGLPPDDIRGLVYWAFHG